MSSKFMIRGQPHHNYARHKKLCDKIFEEFSHGYYRGLFAKLHRKYGPPARTIEDWFKKYTINENWRPYDYSIHGLHHRIFTDEEESHISDFIIKNFINAGFIFQDQDFILIAMQAFLEKHQNSEIDKEFSCSSHFIKDFKNRNKFSSRKPHLKRRPESDGSRLQQWECEMSHLLANVPQDRILNAEETAWKIMPNGITTWAIRGSDNVKLIVEDDTKECLSVMATITAAGTKLPLFIVTRGKTSRVEESQAGDVWPHHTSHSESGWMTEKTFEEYLKQIRQHYSDDLELHLILDIYPCHRTDSVKQMATGLNIILHYIPADYTDEY